MERQYDEYERMSYAAMMVENASRIKHPKATDLFKRPTTQATERKSMEERKQDADATNEWLSRLTAVDARKE